MRFDVPTFLNVLGLVLTVLFFVIGYRQTIGARKERARAANKRIVDVLFRRLTHEDDFALAPSTVDKLLEGWALDARIRWAEILTSEEVESLLMARVMDNDYISSEQRKSIILRVENMFKEEPSSLNSDTQSGIAKKRADNVFLAIGSGLAALATSSVFAFTISDEFTGFTATESVVFIPMAMIVALTTLAIGMYSYLRDTARSARIEGGSIERPAAYYDRSFYRVASRYIPTLMRADEDKIDFIYTKGGESFGIELRTDVNRLGKARLMDLVNNLSRTADELGLSKVYIVTSVSPRDDLRTVDGKIEFIGGKDFIDGLRRAKPAVAA